MKKTSLILALCALSGTNFGCSQDGGGEDAITFDDAVAVQALSEGEDGSDESTMDATDDTPVMDRDCSFGGVRKRVLASYDDDGDGKLSADERANLSEDFDPALGKALRHHGTMRRHLMRLHRVKWLRFAYDDNGDKKLDDTERAELRADLETRCENRKAQLLEKFDANDDGTLDDSEWRAALKDLAMRFAKHREQMLAKFDTDGSGKLDLEERYDARVEIRGRVEAMIDELKADYDTDGDGTLDADETAALKEYLKERVRGEHFGEPL